MIRHAKIVATLGPASSRPETITAMVRAGMDVVRLNTSHGTVEEHLHAVEMVREISAAENKPVAVLMDLGGPKLRTGPVKGGGEVILEPGKSVELTHERCEGTAERFTVEYPRLTEDVRSGERVLLDDGNVELEVQRVTPDGLECRIVYGGAVGARKGVSFPNSTLTMPAITERDRTYLEAGVKADVDLFALSFVRDAGDVALARQIIQGLDADTPIIAKIERRQAIENLDEILSEADGAMVARGDLGVELPPEEVPVQQRRIIASAAKNMIPVITATQMLESMVHSPRPTRAESSDVANAIWNLSDAVMLSQETAVGIYPVEAVAMMDRIIRRAEEAQPPPPVLTGQVEDDDHAFVVALAARRIVESDRNMRGIVCFTRSGHTAFLLSKVNAQAPVYAVTPDLSVSRRLSLARSVIPLFAEMVDSSEAMLQTVDRLLAEGRHVAEGEEVVVIASMPVHSSGATNFLKLHRVGESKAY